MIEIEHLSKQYGNRLVLSDINLKLPDKGLIGIVGSSGSGKTTLLNSLAGLDREVQGRVLINGVDITKLKAQEMLDFRLHHIGYVFQNFNLLNLETGENNIRVVLDSSTNVSREFKKRKIRRLFAMFNSEHLRKMKVNKMSGGEKQRVAIMRAIVNKPSVVLCDEPTGALDQQNSKQIMEILQQISVNSLVLVVTHDAELIKKYADKMVEIWDGKITSKHLRKASKISKPAIEGTGQIVKHGRIPFSFKMRYAKNKMKSKKFRTIISNLMFSLSLTGIGCSFLLTSLVNKKMDEAFSDLVNGNQIVMSLKNESANTYSDVYSADEQSIQKIQKKYEDKIKGIGVSYFVNFEEFFQDGNNVYLNSELNRFLIPGLSARHFNEYKWYERNMITYPYSVDLTEDDVVLGLPFNDISNICYELNLSRSYASFGQYLRKTLVQISLEVRNDEWQYDDSQLFNVLGVIETSRPMILHSSHLWNKYVFEDHMRFPSLTGGELYFPWEMQKTYFIEPYSDPNNLLNTLLFDPDLHDYVFQKTNSSFTSALCNSTTICGENRIFVFYSNVNGILPFDTEYISTFFPDLEHYFFTSSFGYSSFGSNLLSGFSKNFFISLDQQKIDDAIDADTTLSEEKEALVDLPDGIIGGNYLQSLDGALRFSTDTSKLSRGRLPKSNSEIVVSSGVAKKLTPQDALGKRLYVASLRSETVNQQQQMEKEYSTASVVIVGIVDEEKDYVFHQNLWTISFFRDNLEINPFSLIPNGVIFELKQSVDTAPIINELSKMYPKYSFTNPQDELTSSMGNTIEYARVILLSFSLIALVISLLLLGTIVLISINENKADINLFHYLGLSRHQIHGVFEVQTLLRGLLAFLVSLVEMVVIENVLSYSMGQMFHFHKFQFSFTPLPNLIILICATILPVLVTKFILVIVSKRKMIE